ncbi:hypothetical protein RIF29_28981 [Crotalaria pallida]|uniref:Cation/H+ exchanger domain-containing protein n=1 Tax=Crotalaria pallida TaxID=3830 RepID=A0AAN9EE55_CROPI
MSLELVDPIAYVNMCVILPPQVNSNELWLLGGKSKTLLPTSSLPILQMQMCIIFFGTLLFHTFLRHLGIPRFTSMSIVGFILGTRFNKTWEEKMKELFNPESQQILGLFSTLGYLLFLFYIGVKTDMSVVHRTRKIATSIGTAAVMAPFLCGNFVLQYHSSYYLNKAHVQNLGFITVILSQTPYPVISSVLNDLKILNSELGRLCLSSSLVAEMFTIFLVSMMEFTELLSRKGQVTALFSLTIFVLFLFLVIFVIRPAMFWIIKQTPEGSLVSDHYVYCLFVIAFVSAYVVNKIEFEVILGPYILGLAIPEGPPLGTAIIKKIDTIVNSVLMPIFVTTCAMKVDLKQLFNWRDEVNGTYDHYMVETLNMTVVTFIAKFIACMILPLYNRMPLNDTVCLTFAMSCKGIVEMAGYSFVKELMNMPDNVFALLMVSMVLNSTAMPMLVRFLYDPMQKYAGYTERNILNLGSDGQLRVLTCIHEKDNILSTINLLEATYPTKEEPLYAYVLHLVELIGRASPIFISHQLQKRKSNDSKSYLSEDLLDAFDNFEQVFKGALTVNTFTAVSPAEMMYDDICTLALDKLTSLIVLPFHKKWPSDVNSIELEDESVRDLNYRVMDRAPCSVGVLIERAQMTHIFSLETPYTVCMLFIGGKDDREALFFAKRMTKNPHVRLTVIRFLASNTSNHDSSKDWQGTIDSELLQDIKINHKVGGASVKYIEESVKDGPETALIIRKLVNEYDLIIVGRQAGIETPQTSGLLQWSEYPELGVLGDLLASTDAAGKASIFVLQQQRTAMGI